MIPCAPTPSQMPPMPQAPQLRPTPQAPQVPPMPPTPQLMQTPPMPQISQFPLILCGCDLVEISRLEKPRARLLDRLFDQEELDLCGSRPSSLAAFYAAKEAFAKALGCGLLAAKGLSFKDIGIRKTSQGAPYYIWGDRVNQLLPQLSFPQSAGYTHLSAEPRYPSSVADAHLPTEPACSLDVAHSHLPTEPRYFLSSASLSLSHEAGLAMAFAVLRLEPLPAGEAARGG